MLYRSNLVIIGLPFTQQLMPVGSDISPIIILIALVIPIYNILAVITLESFNGTRSSIKHLFLEIAKNPMIVATAVGVLCSFLNVRFPSGLEKAIEQVSVAASVLMLFVLGCFFQFSDLKGQIGLIVPAVIGRLIVIPAIMLTVGYYLGFRDVEFVALISVFASSTATTTFTMSQQLGGDGKLANNAVVATSFLCSFTLCIWATVFKLLGAF